MKTAILGMGIAGSFLNRLLLNRQLAKPTCYHISDPTPCGEKPCGWGIPTQDYLKLCQQVNLDPEEFLLHQEKTAYVEDMAFNCDTVAFNKPRFLQALRRGVELVPPRTRSAVPTGFDRVILARGHPHTPLLRIACVQWRVMLKEPQPPQFRFHPDVGYAWLIPLGPMGFHIGAGTLRGGFREASQLPKRLLPWSLVERVLCGCSSYIHLSPLGFPQNAQNTVPLGEEAGMVTPIAFAGNAPSMYGALALADHWQNFPAYHEAISHHLGHFPQVLALVSRLSRGDTLHLGDLPVMKREMRFSGVSPGLLGLYRLNRKLKTIYSSNLNI